AVYRAKTEAVLAYATHKKCRSQMLLSYFDEDTARKCGKCDVCLEERRQRDAGDIIDIISDEIVQLISIEPLTLTALVTAIKRGTDNQKIEAIRALLDTGRIKANGERYYL
ncbi:MAG: RecQ family ATP-dependent DNA helicase, partial [Sphingobacteriales bacterium]